MASQRDDFGGMFYTTAVLDLAAIATITAAYQAVTVPGVLATDVLVNIVPPSGLEAGVIVSGGYVSAANTVQVRLGNPTAGSINPASATWGFVFGRR